RVERKSCNYSGRGESVNAARPLLTARGAAQRVRVQQRGQPRVPARQEPATPASAFREERRGGKLRRMRAHSSGLAVERLARFRGGGSLEIEPRTLALAQIQVREPEQVVRRAVVVVEFHGLLQGGARGLE